MVQELGMRRHHIQHNDTQHNDTQYSDIQCNSTQHNDIQHYDAQYNDIRRCVIMLNDNILNVVAPAKEPFYTYYLVRSCNPRG
jgi:hypothetical protein